MAKPSGGPLVIFDCNGVIVDSEPIAASVLAEAIKRIASSKSVSELFEKQDDEPPVAADPLGIQVPLLAATP